MKISFYRVALALFVSANIVLFIRYMDTYQIPWTSMTVFLGFVMANAPILVSIQFSAKADETLKGHWLNWLNILIPLTVGSLGLLLYGKWVHLFHGHPAVFMQGPLALGMVFWLLVAVLIQIYVFVNDR